MEPSEVTSERDALLTNEPCVSPMTTPTRSLSKNQSGHILNSDSCNMIFHCYTFRRNREPERTVEDTSKIVAGMLSVSERTVFRKQCWEEKEGERRIQKRSEQIAESRRSLTEMFSWVALVPVFGLFMWAYYAYVVVYCSVLMDHNSVVMTLIFGIGFHLLFFLCLWSYVQTVVTTAPVIPRMYSLSVDEQQAVAGCRDDYKRRAVLGALATQRGVLTVGLDGCARYCDQCQLMKPDRCHHCSSCGRCIPKMDHHCPWFDNCVHFTNYKFFLLTLFYLVLLSVFSAATTGTYVVLSWLGAISTPPSVHMTVMLFVGVVLALCIGVFLCTHLSMVLTNQTTLEDMCGPIFRNPEDSFDIGRYDNFVEVFGPRVWLWMLPIFTSVGDGVRFATRLHPVPGSLERLSTFAALRTPAPDGSSLLQRPALAPKPPV